MITNPQKNSHRYFRQLMPLVSVAVLLMLFSFQYQSRKDKIEKTVVNKIETSFIDTLPGKMKIFEKAEIDPAFPGGDVAWRKYLKRNLDASIPTRNNAKPGNYTVFIQFIVHDDGSMSDIKALTTHGYGMEKEAIRMIGKGPRWLPAIQHGQKVNAYYRQRFDFNVVKANSTTAVQPDSTGRSRPEITLAELRKADFHKILNLPERTEIVSYRLTIDRDNDILQVSNTGEQVSPAARNLINEAKPDRLITIEDIMIRKDNKEQKIPSRFFYVTN